MTSSAITPFLFGESTIRTITQAGAPWFVIADICRILEMTNPTMVSSRLHPDDLSTTEVIDSMARSQTVNICNESGLYSLIFQSRKAAAREFTRWVTSEVLPAIRRTGTYHRGHQAFLGLLKDQIALGVSPDLAARMAGKLTGIPKAEILGFQSNPGLEDDILSITSLLQPGVSYSVEDIADLLPTRSELVRGSKSSRASRIGKILTKAIRLQRITKIPGRLQRYQLPTIAEFQA